MRSRTADALRDALTAIAGVHHIVSTLRFDAGRFEREPIPRGAIYWQFHVLGQALRRIHAADRAIQIDVPEIREAIATRTAMSKRYDELDTEIIWATAINDMDPLRKSIQQVLRDAGEPLI